MKLTQNPPGAVHELRHRGEKIQSENNNPASAAAAAASVQRDDKRRTGQVAEKSTELLSVEATKA